MGIKTILDSLDDVEEGFRALYTQVDDRFVLQVEGIDDHPDVANLRNAYKRRGDDLTKAKDELRDVRNTALNLPDDFDAELWEKLKSGEPSKEADAKAEAKLVEMRKALEAERDEWKGKFEGEVTSRRTEKATGTLKDALLAAGVTEPAFLDASTTMLRDKISFTDDGKPVVESDMGPMAPTDFVAKWAAADGKAFVTKAKGGGAGGGSDQQSTANSTVDKRVLKAVPGLADLPVS